MRAVNRDFGTRAVAFEELDVDGLACRDDDRTIGQRVRADRHQRDRFDMRFEDRPAATQGIGRRSGRRRHDEPVARVSVDVLPGHVGGEVDHAALACTLHDDVVEAESGRHFAAAGL